MRFIKQIFFILMTTIILGGCSSVSEDKTIFSEQLIYGKIDEIYQVQIDTPKESKSYQNSLIINQITEKLQGIELRPLPVDEEMELFEEKEVLYSIMLFSSPSLNHGEESKGGIAIIFTTGEIVFPDIKTMRDRRTISYINVNEEIDKREAIASFIESL